MDTLYKVKKENGETVFVEVSPDDMACNPRDDYCDDGTHFFTWLRRHSSPDENPYGSIEEFIKDISGLDIEIPFCMSELLSAPEIKDRYYIFPVYLYEHGNVCYRMETPFNDKFDSGFAGFIYGAKDTMKKYYGAEKDENYKNILDSHVKDYSAWANGDCWLISEIDIYGDYIDENHEFLGDLYDVEQFIKSEYGCSELEEIHSPEDAFIEKPCLLFDVENTVRYIDMSVFFNDITIDSVEEAVHQLLSLGDEKLVLVNSIGSMFNGEGYVSMSITKRIRDSWKMVHSGTESVPVDALKLWEDYVKAFWDSLPSKMTSDILALNREVTQKGLRMLRKDKEFIK